MGKGTGSEENMPKQRSTIVEGVCAFETVLPIRLNLPDGSEATIPVATRCYVPIKIDIDYEELSAGKLIGESLLRVYGAPPNPSIELTRLFDDETWRVFFERLTFKLATQFRSGDMQVTATYNDRKLG